MRTFEALANAAVFITSRRQAAHLKGNEDQEKVWLYLRALCNFVQVTGQVYRFEDFREATPPSVRPSISLRVHARPGAIARMAAELLLNAWDETPDAQRQHVLLLVSLINFIVDTRQADDSEDFFSHQQEHAPVAVAHFASHEEAKAWLRGAVELPSPAYILIGDEYHQFWYRREDNTRGTYRDYPIETELEALTARGLPEQAPSFATPAEAEEWLMNHPANPYAFVRISGEFYFAVNHRRLKRHSLHHVASTLKAWEEHKRAIEREAVSETTPSDGTSE